MKGLLAWWTLAWQMGIQYVLFRLFYQFRKQTGLLKSSYPVSPVRQTWISLSDWKQNTPAFFVKAKEHHTASSNPSSQLAADAQRILNGEICFFFNEWKKIEVHDWLKNPQSGHTYSLSHWTEIPDFHPALGDIKYVWEKGRFGFVQTIVRYDSQRGADSSQWLLSVIESWIDHNPVNRGPHWQCSQEISLRLINWTIALNFYKSSPFLTEELFQKIIFAIYWQLRHVRANISFSRIAVRNNHAITESLALYMGGLQFPFFKEAHNWKRDGKQWFEEEIGYQIYPDGGYLQFSMNYHRVAVQLMSFGIALAKIHNDKFSSQTYERACKSIELLNNCQDQNTGWLPNYGANDGSLFFKWNDEHYRNFKPALDTLHFQLTGRDLYPEKYQERDWFLNSGSEGMPAIKRASGSFEYPNAGIYGFRSEDLLIVIPCPEYVNRPSQADSLHLDLWYKGSNILRDAGSFQYNTDPELVDYFFGTSSHNTLMIGNFSQMKKGPRFVWFNWTKTILAGWTNDADEIVFTGEIEAFNELGGVRHHRTIKILSLEKILEVTDKVNHSHNLPLRQLWHLDPEAQHQWSITARDKNGNLKPEVNSEAWYSTTYGKKERSPMIQFSTDSKEITTRIKLL